MSCHFIFQENWENESECIGRQTLAVRMGTAQLVECLTRDQKFASLSPDRIGWEIFFSRVNFLCWLLFGVCSSLVLLQWHVKDPSHSAKSAGGRLQLNTHTHLTQRSQRGLCRCPGTVWEPIQKWAYSQLVREHSATVVSTHWATVYWSWPKEWN